MGDRTYGEWKDSVKIYSVWCREKERERQVGEGGTCQSPSAKE